MRNCRSRLWSAGAAGMLAALILVEAGPPVAAEAAETAETARTVEVTAAGWVTAEPDVAVISAGVTTEAKTAGAAVARNNAVMEKLIGRLKDAGIPERDLRTTHLSVSPRYTQPKHGSERTIDGYRASNRVRVTVRDASRLGGIVDRAVSLGANDIGNISFEFADTEKLTDAARTQAIENARRRAELYVKAAGVGLGEVLTITELGQGSPGGSARQFGGLHGAVPIVPGARTIEVLVRVVYALR